MTLALISGKVSRTINGSNLTNALSKSVFGNSSFLRNDERGVDVVASTIGIIQNTLTDLAEAAGIRKHMYVIGQIENEFDTSENSEDWFGRQVTSLQQSQFGKSTATSWPEQELSRAHWR